MNVWVESVTNEVFEPQLCYVCGESEGTYGTVATRVVGATVFFEAGFGLRVECHACDSCALEVQKALTRLEELSIRVAEEYPRDE